MMSLVNDIRIAFVDLAVYDNITNLDAKPNLDASAREVVLASEATVLLAKYAAHLRYVLRGVLMWNEPGVMNVIAAEPNVALREAYRCLLEIEEKARLSEVRGLVRFPSL